MIHHLGRVAIGCAVVMTMLAGAVPATPQTPSDPEQIRRELRALAWQRGPSEGRIGTVATLKVAEGQAFLDGPNTRRFLELNQNPPRDNHYTLASGRWFAIFHFEDSGYIKDDEKLDPDELLRTLKASDEPSNQERKRLGMPAMYTLGWHVPPHYDLNSKQLEWGMRIRTEDNETIVNYTMRLLGRRGVVKATLVSDPERLDQDIADFRTALTSYSFTPGERYAEFRAGDRVAEYGLAALVLGGAAVVATKSGFGKAIAKFVVVGVAAAGSAIAAFFRRLRRRP
jgi:uncharacterized membrane-anchored protein